MISALIALGIGALLAVGALAFVLYPLFFDVSRTRRASAAQLDVSRQPSLNDVAIAALREIEFDRATGKLSDADYVQLKQRYTADALASMRGKAPIDVSGPPPQSESDEIEAAIHAYRAQRPSCPSCGPRPEVDAIFCSSCGRYLRRSCERCGARIEEFGARFCASCGHRLAA